MPNVSKLTIAGHCGADAELTHTQKGDAMAKFSVAVNHRDDSTTWFRVTVWGKYAVAIHPYVKKGMTVVVIGRFQPKSYAGKDGTLQWSFDVDADDVIVAGGNENTASEPRPTPQAKEQSTDDIPF